VTVPEWFKRMLVELRLQGLRYVTKGKAAHLAYAWYGKRLSPESVARYIRYAVEEGLLIPARRRGKGIYYLTHKVDALLEVEVHK